MYKESTVTLYDDEPIEMSVEKSGKNEYMLKFPQFDLKLFAPYSILKSFAEDLMYEVMRYAE